MHENGVSFTVLGPVSARAGHSSLPVAAPSQQALLAQLLLQANRTISASALIDGIYGDAAPRHPEAALQIIVSRLRRALGALATRLVHDGHGYRIEVAADELDLTRARSLFAHGTRAARQGEMVAAADAFDDALSCWTGDALSELSKFWFHHTNARCLREFQFEIVERRNDAYLECGRHADVLRDVDSWIAAEPWREGLRGQQMTALYRAGRQIEALAVYDEVRDLLVNGFGVDPSRELQHLYGSILRQELQVRAAETNSLVNLRPFADCESVFIVEGGPNVDSTWVVGEFSGRLPENDRALPRIALAEFLASMRVKLTNELDAKRVARLAR